MTRRQALLLNSATIIGVVVVGACRRPANGAEIVSHALECPPEMAIIPRPGRLALCMDRLEVSVREYDQCVAKGVCPAVDTGGRCNSGLSERLNHPANCVGHEAAARFCDAHGKRLPREDEWLLAAAQLEIPADGEVDTCWRHPAGTCPRGGHPGDRSRQGIHDLAGSVTEWTDTLVDPVGWGGDCYWYRGGSFMARNLDEIGAGARGFVCHGGDAHNGFRCAADPR